MLQQTVARNLDGRTMSTVPTMRPAMRRKVISCSAIKQPNVVEIRAMSGAVTSTVSSPKEAYMEEPPHQLVAWLKAGIVAAAHKQQGAEGGKELRSLQNMYQVLNAYGGRPEATLSKTLASTTPWLADLELQHAALDLSWHALDGINNLNEQPGLTFEKLDPSIQELVYNVLLDLGCSTSWATPVYRPLPAAAAGLVAGTLGKIPLKQCIELTGHLPSACFEHYDGSWDGECTIYLRPYQLVPVTELARALNVEQAMKYLRNCGSSKSLSELLLLQLHKGLLAVGPEWVEQGMQHQKSQGNHAVAAAAVMVDDSYLTTNSCEDGGGRGFRGSVTAVGADGGDGVAVRAAVVPAGLKHQRRDRQSFLVSPLVVDNNDNSEVSSSSSQPSSKRGVLRRLGSALRRFCRRSRRN